MENTAHVLYIIFSWVKRSKGFSVIRSRQSFVDFDFTTFVVFDRLDLCQLLLQPEARGRKRRRPYHVRSKRLAYLQDDEYNNQREQNFYLPAGF